MMPTNLKGRTPRGMTKVSILMPKLMWVAVDALARQKGESRDQIVRLAVNQYLHLNNKPTEAGDGGAFTPPKGML